MSIDINLVIDTGGNEPATVHEVGNYTTNVLDMWYRALENPIETFNGRECKDALSKIDMAVRHMEANPALYRSMNPPNGWGDYEGALHYLKRLRTGCQQHPKASIHIST